jgi:hypothetical protein
MSRLDDPPHEWRYGVRLRGLWVAQNGTWERDCSHPAVYWWPTMHQARGWRERHMPDTPDAWPEAMGIFQNGRLLHWEGVTHANG